MLPVLPPGTLVVVRRSKKRLNEGRVVVVRHEGKEKIKRIKEIKDNQVFLEGDHTPASTDSRQFGWVDVEYIKGRVIWPRKV